MFCTRPGWKSQPLHAQRHQYITELLGSGKVIAETFISDSSQSPWERTLAQVEHPH
jgi:hypothetical protein